MTIKNETFASLFDRFTHTYDLRPVFNDFLTMTMCAVTPIPGKGVSHFEDIYLQTVEKYKSDELRFLFPKLFAQLILEMEQRKDDSQGNDVLGEYYEQRFCRKGSGQFFTPPHICQFMAHSICGDATGHMEPKRIIDPTCGSGRMLLAAAKIMGKHHNFYGIDIDHTCVQMTALNLFLNGIFHAEIMCANALLPGDFRISYVTSILPFGIFRREEKEQSVLWHLYQNTFHGNRKLSPPEFRDSDSSDAGPSSQISLF